MRNKLFAYMFSTFVCQLATNEVCAQEGKIDYRDLCNVTLSEIVYDTMEGSFFYENLVKGYVTSDVITKSGGFIRAKDDINRSYRDGYYILNPICLNTMRYKNIFHYDSTSICSFASKQLDESINDGTLYGVTKINPFEGVYYKKYFLKIEVLKIGLVWQRVPCFDNCNTGKRKKKKKNYVVEYLPTYMITNVFSVLAGSSLSSP